MTVWYLNQLEERSTQMENSSQEKIRFYGASWCFSSRRARAFLDENYVSYEWIDIDKDEEGCKFVEKATNGFRSVPTVAFPDGSVLIEPTTQALAEKLGLS